MNKKQEQKKQFYIIQNIARDAGIAMNVHEKISIRRSAVKNMKKNAELLNKMHL